MNRVRRLRLWLYAIGVSVVYSLSLLWLSIQIGIPIFSSPYDLEWVAIGMVLVFSCVLCGEIYENVEVEDFGGTGFSYFLSWLGVAIVMVAIGLFFHIAVPFLPLVSVEQPGYETVLEFLFLLDVKHTHRVPITVILAHTMIITAIVGVLVLRKIRKSKRDESVIT